MAEELYLMYKIKDRKSGKLKECYVKIPDITPYLVNCEEVLNPHEYKVIEKALTKKEDYEKWKQNLNSLKMR